MGTTEPEIPEHLASTLQMLRCAYPDGLPEASYFPVLSILYEEMSDRNLAELMTWVTDKSYAQASNDIGTPGRKEQLDVRLVRSTQILLNRCGYMDWLAED